MSFREKNAGRADCVSQSQSEQTDRNEAKKMDVATETLLLFQVDGKWYAILFVDVRFVQLYYTYYTPV